ncbi:hypothetical protein, partial [Burkholderia pseudomallei]|uniref:hypothetical protein n=1 Tax=Burkholderia pseudomallei TaxID=28450 RepID=UPI00281628DD
MLGGFFLRGPFGATLPKRPARNRVQRLSGRERPGRPSRPAERSIDMLIKKTLRAALAGDDIPRSEITP